MKLKASLLAVLAVAVVALGVHRALGEPRKAKVPRLGDWASTSLICREGALTLIDSRPCRGGTGCEDRLTWTPAGGESWHGDERVRALSIAEVQAVLAQLEPLDFRPSDLLSCDPFLKADHWLTVVRHCAAANATLTVSPVRREWGLTRCGEPRCGGSPVEFASCVVKENWVEARRTHKEARVEQFARRFRAAL